MRTIALFAPSATRARPGAIPGGALILLALAGLFILATLAFFVHGARSRRDAHEERRAA